MTKKKLRKKIRALQVEADSAFERGQADVEERLLNDEAIGRMTERIMRGIGMCYAGASSEVRADFWDVAYMTERDTVRRAILSTLGSQHDRDPSRTARQGD